MSAFNWLDYVFLVALALSAFSAFRKGFSREVIGLAASLAAIVFAMWFYGLAGSIFRPYVESERIANFIGFVAVLIGIWTIGGIVSWTVQRFLRTIGLSWFDRLLGIAFGLLRGTLICVALLTGYMAFGPHVGLAKKSSGMMPDGVLHSQIAPYVLQASRAFVALAPADLKQSFLKYYFELEAAWQPSTESTGQPIEIPAKKQGARKNKK